MVDTPSPLEDLALNPKFWPGKRVLLTGHTGFKGSWMSLWLKELGAAVAGYALRPAEVEALFNIACVAAGMDESVYADIRSTAPLFDLVERFKPEIVFHLAAQSLVRTSYVEPIETYHTNVMGTANVLEAVRRSGCCRVVVVVTSDKCYEDRESVWGYRETDPMGGHDPYSSSKGCAELVTAAYRHSFFETADRTLVAVASARAGNVIGGGDFSKDRLIPDAMAALLKRRVLRIRSPEAIRPWQHVLEPLSGYLLLAEKLWSDPKRYSQSWNFGPAQEGAKSVRWILQTLVEYWGEGLSWEADAAPTPYEANRLTLDSTKARTILGWSPRWPIERALQAIVEWYKAYTTRSSMRNVVLGQISSYESTASARTVSLSCTEAFTFQSSSRSAVAIAASTTAKPSIATASPASFGEPHPPT